MLESDNIRSRAFYKTIIYRSKVSCLFDAFTCVKYNKFTSVFHTHVSCWHHRYTELWAKGGRRFLKDTVTAKKYTCHLSYLGVWLWMRESNEASFHEFLPLLLLCFYACLNMFCSTTCWSVWLVYPARNNGRIQDQFPSHTYCKCIKRTWWKEVKGEEGIMLITKVLQICFMPIHMHVSLVFRANAQSLTSQKYPGKYFPWDSV